MGLRSDCIQILPLNEAVMVESVEVTALDANHCPGSVMLLFKVCDLGWRLLLHVWCCTPLLSQKEKLKRDCRKRRRPSLISAMQKPDGTAFCTPDTNLLVSVSEGPVLHASLDPFQRLMPQ
jgi:hypothetical protein